MSNSNERLVYEYRSKTVPKFKQAEATRKIPRRLDKIDREAIREGRSIDFMRLNSPYCPGRGLIKAKAFGNAATNDFFKR